MLKQPYKCNKCNLLGIVLLPDRCGVVQAVNIMRDHHDQENPSCKFHVDNITVFKPSEDILDKETDPCD
jgi:hypothetical protein